MKRRLNPSKDLHLQGNPLFDSELFQMIVSQIGDEVIVINRDGKIVYANEAAAEGLGYSKGQLMRMPIVNFLRERITIEEWKKVRFFELKKSRHPISYVLERVVKGGKIQTINVTAAYMSHEDMEYVVSVARDVTKEIYLQDKLKEAEKMKALETFIGELSQQFEHPMKAVAEHIDELIAKYRSKDFEYLSFKEFSALLAKMDLIGNQIRQCTTTMANLGEVNRRKFGLSERSANVNLIMQDSARLFKSQLDQSMIKLSIIQDKNLPMAAIAPAELGQVINNVLSNAIQSIPLKGSIVMRTAYLAYNKTIQIECQDQGIGIPKEHLSRIFEPFFTTEKKGKDRGKGLGLSIVYSIVKNAYGDITIKSSLREGTLVKILLPIVKE